MTNELIEAIDAALAFSRNFATAKPDIGKTEREHILGLANLLERTQTALRSAVPAGYRLVREVKECQHCGWLCAPNSAQTKSWYPLKPEAAPEVGRD